MPSRYLDADEPFFREWSARRPKQRRSLRRARELAALLHVDRISQPILIVVGSKGKATTAVYASAILAASGLRVGTLSSPPIIDNRERIRINGLAISERTYASLSKRLADCLAAMRSGASANGYLSPTGLFTLVGVCHMIEEDCDVLVLEAGMGGRSDEVSLFQPKVVCITRVFEEHLGILGSSIREIAEDKVGVVTSNTQAVFSVAQVAQVAAVLDTRALECGLQAQYARQPGRPVEECVMVQGLSRQNAFLGVVGALAMDVSVPGCEVTDDRICRVLRTVNMPGRSSYHEDGKGRGWVVDAAIDEVGATAALEVAEKLLGGLDVVLVSIPDDKDVMGVLRAVGERRCVPVRVDVEHLRYSQERWSTSMVDIKDIDGVLVTSRRVAAIGTWSFVSAILERLGVTCQRMFVS